MPNQPVGAVFRPDFEVKIPYSQIEPEDILLLAGELNLTPTAAETTYLLRSAYNERWLATFLDHGFRRLEFVRRAIQRQCRRAFRASATPENDGDRSARRSSFPVCGRRMTPSARFCRAWIPERASCWNSDRMGRSLPYILVANILTRRIHADYVRKKEESYNKQGTEPRPLVITIEEAHKFLSPGLVNQTIFGTIARELRKYNVTLLIVDQRPSGIDDEVLSQVGTRVTCLLNDDKDIDAVLTGISGAKELRSILASLDSKQQALVLGHAVPMPIVIRTRTYDDEAFRRAMGGFGRELRARSVNGTNGTEMETAAAKCSVSAEEVPVPVAEVRCIAPQTRDGDGFCVSAAYRSLLSFAPFALSLCCPRRSC